MTLSFEVTSIRSFVEIIKVNGESRAAKVEVTSTTIRRSTFSLLTSKWPITHHHLAYISFPDMSHLIDVL